MSHEAEAATSSQRTKRKELGKQSSFTHVPYQKFPSGYAGAIEVSAMQQEVAKTNR